MSVFGALNRFISRLDADPQQYDRPGVDPRAYGFQVLRNKNTDVLLEPWFDFIVGINSRQIDSPDSNLFAAEVRNCAGSSVLLTIWNAKGQRILDLSVPVPSPSPTLGITLQWTLLAATEAVWHILDVIPNSPADIAGLLPFSDYIIGTPEGIVHGESGLGELVEDHLNRPLRLYVYNHEYSVSRKVTITPSRGWGGEGALGCMLGYGALHRLPAPLNEPPAAPGDTLFETVRFSNEEPRASSVAPHQPQQNQNSQVPSLYPRPGSSDLFVPGNMSAPPKSTSPVVRQGRKARHGVSPNLGFDEMFAEGEQKSKEDDYTTKAKATAPPPPPQKKSPASSGLPPPLSAREESHETKSPAPIISDNEDEE